MSGVICVFILVTTNIPGFVDIIDSSTLAFAFACFFVEALPVCSREFLVVGEPVDRTSFQSSLFKDDINSISYEYLTNKIKTSHNWLKSLGLNLHCRSRLKFPFSYHMSSQFMMSVCKCGGLPPVIHFAFNAIYYFIDFFFVSNLLILTKHQLTMTDSLVRHKHSSYVSRHSNRLCKLISF